MHGYEGVSVAVLGASGFIGRWVARKLCGAGARVSLVVRNRTAARGIFEQYGVRGEIIEADLADTSLVGDLYRRMQSSVTFNLAGYGIDPSERDECVAYQINSRLLPALCEAVAYTKDTSWSGQHIIH